MADSSSGSEGAKSDSSGSKSDADLGQNSSARQQELLHNALASQGTPIDPKDRHGHPLDRVLRVVESEGIKALVANLLEKDSVRVRAPRPFCRPLSRMHSRNLLSTITYRVRIV